MSRFNKKYNVLIVKTNKYTGNFEREMCAYATGQIGDCEVGEKLINPTISEITERYIEEEPDEHGIFRPVDIFDGEGEDGGNSLCIFFDPECVLIGELITIIDIIKERCLKYADVNNIEILGFEWRTYVTSLLWKYEL